VITLKNPKDIKDEIAKHIKEIMNLLEIKETPSNKNTPKRIAKMYFDEIFKERNLEAEDLGPRITLFPAENNNPVTVKVPFIGLSKIPRIIKFFSQRPQVQERLTDNVGKYLVKCLKPKELSIRVSAEHTCVTIRGVESPCETITVFEYVEGRE